jgi:hypothetical protein
MKIKVTTKDNKTKTLYLFDKNLRTIISSVSEEIDLKTIDKVKVEMRFSFNDLSRVEELKSNIETYNIVSNSKCSIKEINDYIFSIVIVGKLTDSISILQSLNLMNFKSVDTLMKNDINFIKNLMNKRHDRYDYNYSLIIKYLSDNNCNLPYSRIYDMLTNYNNKAFINKVLLPLFKELYNCEINEARIKDSTDKLSLQSINENTLKEIEVYVRSRVDG